jgi:predicted lactoylglutathione lyase
VPFDGQPASVGNGVMVALEVKTPEDVAAVHTIALAQGGTCEGAPGPRGGDGFFAAYFRDPDGNKLNAYCMVAAAETPL